MQDFVHQQYVRNFATVEVPKLDWNDPNHHPLESQDAPGVAEGKLVLSSPEDPRYAEALFWRFFLKWHQVIVGYDIRYYFCIFLDVTLEMVWVKTRISGEMATRFWSSGRSCGSLWTLLPTTRCRSHALTLGIETGGSCWHGLNNLFMWWLRLKGRVLRKSLKVAQQMRPLGIGLFESTRIARSRMTLLATPSGGICGSCTRSRPLSQCI